MENKPLKFIDILDINTGRRSSISIDGRQSGDALTVVGGLNHSSQFVPASKQDGEKLISWLSDWIKAQQTPNQLKMIMKTETPNLKPAAGHTPEPVDRVSCDCGQCDGFAYLNGARFCCSFHRSIEGHISFYPKLQTAVYHHAALVEALEAVANCEEYYYVSEDGEGLTKEFQVVLKRSRAILATVKREQVTKTT